MPEACLPNGWRAGSTGWRRRLVSNAALDEIEAWSARARSEMSSLSWARHRRFCSATLIEWPLVSAPMVETPDRSQPGFPSSETLPGWKRMG